MMSDSSDCESTSSTKKRKYSDLVDSNDSNFTKESDSGSDYNSQEEKRKKCVDIGTSEHKKVTSKKKEGK